MQWIYGIGELLEYTKINNLKLGFVNISEWEKSINRSTIHNASLSNPGTKSTLIPNPVMDDIINEVILENIPKKKHKFIFHPLWARGGDVAIQAVRELEYEDSEFHAFTYLLSLHNHPDSFFHNHMGVDKKTLFRHLAESEYFIYPLYTPYQDVHKDTFSCAVAEALALGVIVITYPLGALPENFNDYCIWLDAPPGANFEKMQLESLSKDEDGIFKYTDNIITKIKYLESNPELKQYYKNAGKQYILDNFNINKIGKMWETFINDLIK
jgi:glycosyltransferase involved in cell wall biosynthesis